MTIGRTQLAIAATTLFFACSTDSGGPRSVTVGAELQDGSANPAAVCVRLPALLGSVVQESAPVGNAFEMNIRALRHSVSFTFPGARNASLVARTASLEQLGNGYAEALTVTGQDGIDYSVHLLSGCTDTQLEDP